MIVSPSRRQEGWMAASAATAVAEHLTSLPVIPPDRYIVRYEELIRWPKR